MIDLSPMGHSLKIRTPEHYGVCVQCDKWVHRITVDHNGELRPVWTHEDMEPNEAGHKAIPKPKTIFV